MEVDNGETSTPTRIKNKDYMSSSGIPPHIAGSVFQVQISAAETAKAHDAQRNKRARDARELARLADQQQHEVEDADHTEGLYVHREEDRPRDGEDARDTYEGHDRQEHSSEKLYLPPKNAPSSTPQLPDQPQNPDHIDLSV